MKRSIWPWLLAGVVSICVYIVVVVGILSAVIWGVATVLGIDL